MVLLVFLHVGLQFAVYLANYFRPDPARDSRRGAAGFEVFPELGSYVRTRSLARFSEGSPIGHCPDRLFLHLSLAVDLLLVYTRSGVNVSCYFCAWVEWG